METARQPKIYRLKNRKQLVALLNGYFLNLNMGKHATVFDKVVERDVKDRFIALMTN